MATKLDKRTNPLLLKSQHHIIAPNVDGDPGFSNNDAFQNDISRRLLSNIANDSESSNEATQDLQHHDNEAKVMVARFIFMGALILFSIVIQMRSNQLQNEVARLRSEVKQSVMSIELRNAKRMKRLKKDNDRVAFMHVLNSFEVSLESDLAGEILAAYG